MRRRAGIVRRGALLALLFLAVAAGGAWALEIPPRPEGRVNDYAGVLTTGERNELERELAAFEQATSNQIVVAVFSSLGEESLEDYVVRLFKAWKLGQDNRDNGILLTVFMAEKRVRIEVGYGLEGAVPDAMASRIIRNEMAPEFQAGRPGAGISRAVTALMAASQGEYKGLDRPRRGTKRSIPPGLIVFIIIITILMIRTSRATMGAESMSFPPLPPGSIPRRRSSRHSSWGGFGGFGGGFGGGGGGGGGGGFGGFSGGGGSSGGGGASGGW